MDHEPTRFRSFSKRVMFAGVGVLVVLHLTMPIQARAASLGIEATPIPGAGMPVYITGNAYQEIQKQFDGIGVTLTTGAITTLMNVAQTFLQRIAYDLAQRILTGDAGQHPMFWEDGFADHMGKVMEDVGNQFISSINSEFFDPILGFNLCTPIDPLSLQLSLMGPGQIGLLQADCDIAKIAANFEQTKQGFETEAEKWNTIDNIYQPNQSELGVNLGLHASYLDAKLKSMKGAELDRRETQGLKQVTDIISGNITTPSQAVKDAMSEAGMMKLVKEKGQLSMNLLAANAFKLGAIQLGLLTASTFVNTLLVGALEKLFGGMTGASVDVSGIDLVQYEGAGNSNVAVARITFSDLLTPNLYTTANQDFVTELSACPTPRNIFNCAMDEALAAALRMTGETGGYTVGRASLVTLNNQPPSNPEFLHKDWELIPDSEVKDNTDPTCYQRAYCASNLAKLRYARILPVGWEMAANSAYNKKRNGKYVTLEEAIRGFNVCNEQGQADSTHPWCHLIDPNWVLTAPSFQCRVQGYSDSIFPGSPLRLQECADAVSCLKRDDKGSCTGGYGFCLAEKPVWRFNGDECLERFASCRTYMTRTKERVSYIRNTIDYGSCSAENVGCLWYATTRDVTATTTAWSTNPNDRIYLDASVKTCAASNDGCTKLYTVAFGSPALNLIRNASFESSPTNIDGSSDDTKLVAWTLSGDYVRPQPEDGASAVEGGRSLGGVANIGTAVSDDVAVEAIRNYTFSVYVRKANLTLNDGTFVAQLRLKDTNGGDVPAGPYFRSDPGCSIKQANLVGFQETASSESWVRYQCTFVANADSAFASVEISGTNVLIDALQLEETEAATSFVDGLASGLTEKHLKVAPEELRCTGRKGEDHQDCDAYARMCSQGDVGCQGYRDVDIPTAPEIPASLSATDFCPASCVGYAEYRKQASTFDLGRNADPRLDDPEDEIAATFVPAYAKSCAIQDVGCEEFTNVEMAAAGGEGKAYFNYIRACEKPGPETATYFTWEGSDTTGYQLRTWSLIKSAPGSAMPPKIVQKAGPDGILKEPSTCNDYTWNLGIDQDCRQIYDTDGNVFYAYFSQTVVSSDSCTDFRKNRSNAADCEKTGGTYTPATGECLYRILPSESRLCGNTSAGCRAYIGTTGRNTSMVLEEDFKATTGTTPFGSEPNVDVSLSNESVLVGDQSLKITGTGTLTVSTQFTSYPNQYYRVSFWAKTTQPAQGSPATLKVDGTVVASIPMEVDWRRYEFGPFEAGTTPTSTITWENLPNATYLDTLRIERLNDVTFVIKDSWTVPTECDRTPEGLPQPQAMVGCRAYEDRDGTIVTVRRFGRLCREEAVGCKAFVDTRNSEGPYAQTFDITGTDTNLKTTPESIAWEERYVGPWQTTRPADRYVYVIDEERVQCDATEASCRMFGKPRLEQDTLEPAPTNEAYDQVYLIDDITSYMTGDGEPNMLCRKDELYCDEFKSGKTVAYFRNPFTHVCEWKDKVLLKANPQGGIPGDGQYTGWFRKGTEKPCYPAVLSSGNTYLIQNSGDPGYTGWIGLCPLEQSECTEFRDPNDHSDPVHITGKPYFFIKNQRVDLKSCNGQVDLLGGCVLFRDMSDVRLRYSTNATYAKSHAEDDTPQSPIDCVTDPDNDFCKSAKFCTSVTLDDCAGNGCSEPLPAICLTEESCQGDPGGEVCVRAREVDACTGPDAVKKLQYAPCQTDADCSVSVLQYGDGNTPNSMYDVTGKCSILNDANVVMKVRLDRDCAKWLGCSTGETVYDPVQQKYTDLCTELSLCDVSKGANAGSFCANYIDRSKEPILKAGAFFTRDLYSTRKTGFGEVDYSGYAIPDQFQAVDLQNRKVAFELFTKEPPIANKFTTDYRLAAAVPETSGLIEFPADENEPVDDLYPNLYICQHTVTGRTGYFLPGITPGRRVCYFPLDALTQRSADIPATSNSSSVDPRSIQALSDVFRRSADPKYDISLMRSFPPAECKANPEGDSPFPSLYVKEWDYTTEPYQPSTIADGYSGVNLCEWGEDCSCSYRKVKYGGVETRYYSPFGKSPAGGICSGGTKDGETCVPQVGESAAQGTNTGVSTEDPGCPGGGRCLDITDVVLVRGQFGQCLQRDMSRTVAGDRGRHPCLVWNPNPILSGTYDAAHYQPTAGYFPPVNAGEYYCLSYANPPVESIWTAFSRTWWQDSRSRGTDSAGQNGDGANPYFYLPGALSKFNFDTGYIAGKCFDDAYDDTCGNGESECSCHDGMTNILSAFDGDFEEIFRAADSENPETSTAWVSSPLTAFQIIEDGSCESLDVGCDVEECREDPIDDLCDEIWRFTNLGQGIDGIKPYDHDTQSPQAARCMRARTDDVNEWEDTVSWPGAHPGKTGVGVKDTAPDADYNQGRWIMTGRGLGKTYMEYFVAVKPTGVLSWLYPGVTDPTEIVELTKTIMREKNFAQFQFYPVNSDIAAACSLPIEYAEGATEPDWNDAAAVKSMSNVVMQAFSRDFDGKLDRSKEELLKDTTGRPRKEYCTGIIGTDGKGTEVEPSFGDDGRCYYKYWETTYRLDGSSTFEWLDAISGIPFFQRKDQYYSHERNCSKSGFALRAVFENVDRDQNSIPESEVQEGQLTGPYNFIGFWVTACKVGDDFESSLFLALKVKHADVCKQIGQVVAPYSRESAVFADRVWARGSFTMPLLGYSYSTQYGPYGSALVHGVPGTEPLFQTGEPVTDYSLLSPPIFLGSGAQLVTTRVSPLQRWAHLTNVFARVYRVYDFFDTGVPINGFACFGGPNKGKACLDTSESGNVAKNDKICNAKGDCDTTKTTVAQKNTIWRCNGLSGVNAGLECGNGNYPMKSLDPTCHNAAMKRDAVSGQLTPQYTACVARSGWEYMSVCQQYTKTGSCSNAYNERTAHEQFNAFGCVNDAVVPGAGCARPEANSKDCPKKITGLTCIPDSFGPLVGHCSGGYEHARCVQHDDCVFTEAQWWGAYDALKFDTVGASTNQTVAKYYPSDGSPPQAGSSVTYQMHSLPFGTSRPRNGDFSNWVTNVQKMENLDRWIYSVPQSPYMGSAPYTITDNPVFYGFWSFASHVRTGAYAVPFEGNTHLLRIWPAPHSLHDTQEVGKEKIIPGLCEGAVGAQMTPGGWNGGPSTQTYGYGEPSVYTDVLQYKSRSPFALVVGVCDGGVNDGQLCLNDSTLQGDEWPHANTCSPPSDTENSTCKRVTASIDVTGRQLPATDCAFDNETGDPFSKDPDLDNNACTRSAGYSPRRDLCGDVADNEKCLIGYDLTTGKKQQSLNQSLSLAPTDVTAGFHKPSFLGFSGANPFDELHIAPYPPRPPTIVAPDLSRTCESPGQCRVSSVNAFSLEEQSAGPVVFSGGKAQVTMRFYGWAAHEQTPLKAVIVDWGDGTFTKIEDARLKNRKPFCGTSRECELIPGLTCNADADCPPAGGKCSERGTCSQNPAKACFRDNECGTGKCEFREFFGNSTDACEPGYFEFSHAYTCNPTSRMPSCPDKLCNRNTSIYSVANPSTNVVEGCDNDGQCGSGDRCIEGLAPASVEGQVGGGCFDEQKVACLYTPRVMLIDSWNWCTGECRAGALVGNEPMDVASSKVKHVYGGCWDGTETVKNWDISTPIMGANTNECSLGETNRNIRPWIVYQGAVQLGSYR
ncbi:MAG: hypothetical protein ABIK13_03455 [Patescibacteria group bacterium]